MENGEIIGRIIKIIIPMTKGKVDIEPETKIIEDKYIDSLSVINLMMEIEREFSVRLGMMDVTIDDFETPTTIAKVISRKLM